MLRDAAKIAGPAAAGRLAAAGLLGPAADLRSAPALSHYTTRYRQDIVFREMKRIVTGFLELWYP
jgi:hypothetical protein